MNMKSWSLRVCLSLAAVAYFTLDGCAAGPAPPPAVSVSDQAKAVTLSNTLITLVFDKPTGEITAMTKDGVEITGHGVMCYDIGWRRIPEGMDGKIEATGESFIRYYAGKGLLSGAGEVAYELVSQDDTHAHIRFHDDKAEKTPLAVELHYVLRAGDSGFYCYVINRHRPGDRQVIYEQSRFGMRIRDGIFTQQAVSPSRIGKKLFSAAEIGKSHQYADAERFPDGTISSKYFWSVYEGDHHVHGIAGSGLGLWVISASSEYCNGGPTKQNLTVEVSPKWIGVLETFQARHYGAGTIYFSRDDAWEKFYGPFFVYLNSGEDFDTLWADAQQRSRQEVEAWPYSWVQHELYPLQRGSVRGQLAITDGSSPEGAWVILAAPTPDWQLQGKGYIFWARADARGRFEIPKVRPGNYSLYAIVDGVLDEYRLDGIEVTVEQTTELGQLRWQPQRYGRQLWQIGVPNRSGREYRHGDDFRHWGLWLKYPQEFPNDVHFTVGQSREREDWNYVQPAVLEADGTYRFPVWHIYFEMTEAPVYGQAVLRMPLAEVSVYTPDHLVTLKVSVNGKEAGRFTDLGEDSAICRSGIQGLYRNRQVCFDARLLQAGRNTIALSYDATQRNQQHQKKLKADMAKLYKESVKHYKAGKLSQAKEGFATIQNSGVKLGFPEVRGGGGNGSQPLEGWPLVSVVYDCLRLEISP